MIENVLQRFASDPKYSMPEIQGWFENWYNLNPTTCRRIFGGDMAEAAPVNPATPEEFAKVPPISNATKINRSLHIDYELRFKNGKITIPTMQKRGTDTNLKIDETTEVTKLFRVPHYKLQDSLIADDFRDRVPFNGGPGDLETVERVMAEKFMIGGWQFENLWEYNFINAVRGYVMDGTSNTILDVYDALGATRKTFQINFGVNNAGDPYHDILEAILYQRRSAGVTFNNRVALCSSEFYETLRTNSVVREAHKYQNSDFLKTLGLDGFRFYDVEWVLYPNGTDDGSTYTPWIEAGAAYLVPLGIPQLFNETFAPADYMETLWTAAANMNSKYELQKFARGMDLEMQTNHIVHLTRPMAVVKLTTETVNELNNQFVTPSPIQPEKRKRQAAG